MGIVFSTRSVQKGLVNTPPAYRLPRGVTTIYACTGCAIFGVPFFRGIIFGKITKSHNFGVSF